MRKFFLLLTINILVCTIDTYCISFLDIDTCSVSIITNDTIIYSDTPTTVQIQLQATQGADYYFWSPSTGVSDPTIPNPMAQITGSIEYVLEAKYLGENLVYNGNFELGNTGFTTDLNYYSTGPTTRGIYSVLSNAHSFELGFCPCNNGGNYMIIDGSTIPEITVYSSRTIVEPNQDYVFSLDLSTINNDPNQSPGNIADIYVLINNVVVENHLTPSANCCIWQTLTLPWNSGNDTTATIIVKDHNTGPWGNDFALDNISLKSVCKAYDTINISILETPSQDSCSIQINDDSIIYTDTAIDYQLYSLPEADYYRWTPSTGLSDPTIANPIAHINSTSQYVLEAMFISDSNLVYNGDFELGNIGFTTDLLLTSQSPSPYGTYIIANDAHLLYWGFSSCTHNGGLFMSADGSPNLTTTYESQVNVEPNTDYIYSVEFANINESPDFVDSWRSIFQLSINGVALGGQIINTDDFCIWNRYYSIWNSGNNTTATINITNLNISPDGNDFALDNISLRKLCKAIDTVNITIYDAAIIPKDIYITICENDFPYQYFDSVFYQAGIYGYVFSTNSETDSLHIVNISTNPKYTTTIFDTICEGETYTLNGFNVYTQGQHTQNLQTIQGCDSIINLNLYVENIEDTIIDAVICNGEVYTNYGFNQHREGTYYGYYLFSGKCNTRIILNLSVINSVEMLLFPQEDMMVEQYPITLDATCTGCDSYIWSSGQSSPTINVYSKGMYKVCAFSDCGYICDSVVINNPDVYVFLPNSFTPSNSSNTVFEIYTQKEKVELVVFEIFDRWGEKIFETKDIYEGWDGTSKGKLCNSDVFAYKVLYKTRYTQDQVFEKTGLVSLIR